MAVLVVAEKPSVARDIARVLGARTKGDNCLTGNNYVVSWAVGHLVTLKDPDELDPRYKTWRMEDLPILPEKMETKVISKTRSQFTVLRKLLNDEQTESVICATDSGREGELIFRYIYEQAKCKKPVQRLWISSMTDEAIRTGFDHLRPSSDYDSLYVSARCRADADWLIGMNASRAFTLRYKVLLSIGRVQTPTLSMLVKRRREIDNFHPETFYTVKAKFGDYEGTYQDAEGQKQIREKEKADAIAGRVAGKQCTVVSATRDHKAEKPPLLYDLTTLQREANRAFGFTANKTLSLAQKLYEEHKLLTYPRTDSRYLSHDMLGKVKSTLAAYDGNLSEMGKFASERVSLSPRVFDDAKLTDHHAIIPTGKKAAGLNLTADERKLYEMAAVRLAQVFYPNYEYDALRVVTACGEDKFVSTGRSILQMGWKALGVSEKKKKGAQEGEEQNLPELHEGDVRTCVKAEVKKDETKPPKEHNDASLLADMEHAGRRIEDEELREKMKDCALGTPATRAATIERLIAVGYVRRAGRNLVATEKGIKLIEAVPEMMASPEVTGQWEAELARIARGENLEASFMQGIRDLSTQLVKAAAVSPEVGFAPEAMRKSRKAPKGIGITCPLCGKGKVAENSKSFYCTDFRDGCRYTVWKDSLVRSGGPVMTEALMRLCFEKKDVRGSTGTIHMDAKGNITFEANRKAGG